jgi:SAM-dependent methyltransferase
MAGYEPTPLEIHLTLLLGTLASGFYRGYINSLPLTGAERVLDFGSGSGVCSRHLADRLARGGSLTCVDGSRGWMTVIRRTLRRYRNVTFCLADLSTDADRSGLPEHGFDALFIHFVLHDIPAAGCECIMRRLAGKLVPGGRLFLREPLEPGGRSVEDFRQMLARAGFREIDSHPQAHWFTGPILVGVYQV